MFVKIGWKIKNFTLLYLIVLIHLYFSIAITIILLLLLLILLFLYIQMLAVCHEIFQKKQWKKTHKFNEDRLSHCSSYWRSRHCTAIFTVLEISNHGHMNNVILINFVISCYSWYNDDKKNDLIIIKKNKTMFVANVFSLHSPINIVFVIGCDVVVF